MKPYYWYPADNVWNPALLVLAIYVLCGPVFLGYLARTAVDALRAGRSSVGELVVASFLVSVVILLAGAIISVWLTVVYWD